VILLFLFINFLDAKKTLPKPKEKIIKISIITPPPPPPPKIVVPPTPKPIIVPPVIVPPKKIEKTKSKKRIIKKKIVKKRIIKKKIVKKRVIKKKIVKKKIIKKHIPKKIVKKSVIKKSVSEKPVVIPEPIVQERQPFIEELYEVYTPPPRPIVRAIPKAPEPVYVAPPTPIYTPLPTPKVDNSAEKRVFLSQVRSQIIANKKYPKIALRRHIEGSVRVKFDIGSSGDVSNIRFISGKSILQKSVRKAVLNSFPISIPNNLREELPINNISVTVNFTIN
jgi:protein TonB